MSTVFYGYIIKKSNFWKFRKKLKEMLLKEDIICENFNKNIINKPHAEVRIFIDGLYNRPAMINTELQLFEKGNYYIFRILSEWNTTDKIIRENLKKFNIKEYALDNRTGYPENLDKLSYGVRQNYVENVLDKKVTNEEYFISIILDYKTDLMNLYYKNRGIL